MRHLLSIFFLTSILVSANAQLTLEYCRERASENYPVIRQYDLVNQSRDFSVSNAAKAYLPQISFSASATYQSDATKFDGELPGIDFRGVSRDQYNFSINVSQNIYDGGSTSTAKKIARRQGDVDYQQVAVSMYDINQRVDDIFFGILTLDEQIRQNQLLLSDLELSYQNVLSLADGGIANQTDVDAVKVEQVQALQTDANLASVREAYVTMLSTFIGRNITPAETFVVPDISTETPLTIENHRPELELYNAQNLLLNERLRQINNDLVPHIGIFAEGGYGDPGLNIFKTGFQPYYRVGASLTWNFGGFYTRSNNRKNIEVERQKIDSQRETFLLNTRLQSQQESGQITSLRRQIAQDDEIITLRESIRSKSEMKVANGTETVNEMLRDINAVSNARLQKALHSLQLIQEIYKLKTINNN